jgi:hypothetical protein
MLALTPLSAVETTEPPPAAAVLICEVWLAELPDVTPMKESTFFQVPAPRMV